jgi:hypothetical protein|nr:MAG TPA: S-adenosyl-L-methionine methyltransferase [Caudoviricetes sp.]
MKIIKPIIDVCCGSKMFWFDKNNPLVTFCDNRVVNENLCDGRNLTISPDFISDFRNMSAFDDDSFKLIVFDPPHLIKVGEKSWLARKYGKLNPETYKNDLKQGFCECFRILQPDGVLIFKWSETDVKTNEIINLSPYKPLFGHISGKRSNTQWIVFIKNEVMKNDL